VSNHHPADDPAHDPWAAVETLLQRMTTATGTGSTIATAVEAVRQATGADAAFWYSRPSGKVAAVSGPRPVSVGRCVAFAGRMYDALPPDQEVARWVNPGSATDDVPTAAVLARAGKGPGCVVALSYAPGRRFDEADAKAARVVVKMLAAQRAHSQNTAKQLLDGLLHSLTAVIDAKDPYTAGHSERVARIALLVARQMGMSPAAEGDVFLAGLLHDLGKIGVRDAVLLKPGPLTDDEMAEVRTHPVIGERIVASVKPFTRLCPAVRHHHERYDGRGYPDGLSGEAIPPIARVLAVADACDAMMSPRRYRAARSPLEIDAILTTENGRQFDPQVVRAFMGVRKEVYPPIYQKGIGDSAVVALDQLVSSLTDASMTRLPPISPGDPGSE
jgi:hypothetical protein